MCVKKKEVSIPDTLDIVFFEVLDPMHCILEYLVYFKILNLIYLIENSDVFILSNFCGKLLERKIFIGKKP